MARAAGGARSGDVDHRVWIISDLQLDDIDAAKRCIRTAVDDVDALNLDFDQIWYLGDATWGSDVATNERVTDIQVDALARLNTPLRYVLGNHDMDYAKETGEVVLPFYEAVQSRPDWRTLARPDDFYFVEEGGDHVVLFLSDHIDPAGKWRVTHGKIKDIDGTDNPDNPHYPHTTAAYRAVTERLSSRQQYAIIAGHTAFPGGNRPSELQRRLFPLPENVRIHFYGHAHVGDDGYVARDDHKNRYRTISSIDDHPIPQIDVASLEDIRGDVVRSVVFEIHDGGDYGVYFRDHSAREWVEAYYSYAQNGPTDR